MKILVVSDIHGHDLKFKKVMKFFFDEKIDKMIVLGDTFSSSYSKNVADNEISNLLWQIPDRLIMVRGNCDGGVAERESPVGLVDYYDDVINGKRMLFYHGHINYSNLSTFDFYIHGHTHVARCVKSDDDKFFLNPGSLGFPRDFTKGTFMTITPSAITIFDIDFNVIYEERY